MGLFSKTYTMETLKYAKERKDKRAIIEHLNGADNKVKLAAMLELGPGDGAAVDPTVKMLDSPDLKIAMEAVLALGRIKDRRAADPLIQYLSRCKPILISTVAKALVSIGDYRAVEPLINRLNTETAPDYHIFCALVEFGDPNAVDAMLKFIKDNEINKELGLIGFVQDPEPYKDIFTDPAVYEKDLDELIKNIFNGIVKTRRERDFIVLGELLRSPDKALHRVAYSVDPNHSTKIEYFIEQLKDVDPDVRQYAIYVLKKSGDIRAIEPIMALLKDGDVYVRNAAAGALKAFNVQTVPKEIIKEIVKIPCKYCGTLVENTAQKCPSCGAPLNPFN